MRPRYTAEDEKNARKPIKQYAITGPRWDSQHLTIQHDNKPIFFINGNNKFGPWKDPYITIHTSAPNGDIVAAAKMGSPGWSRDFRIWLGNPDCTDLETWKPVSCRGKSAFEYRFVVGGREFAWRRTRDKELGARRKGHQDFKLVAFETKRPSESSDKPSSPPPAYQEVESVAVEEEKSISLESVSSKSSQSEMSYDADLPPRPSSQDMKETERVVGIYYIDTFFKSNAREAKINFFEFLPPETELWCLAAVLGLQEKICKSQDVWLMSSFGYGGGLWFLGNYF